MKQTYTGTWMYRSLHNYADSIYDLPTDTDRVEKVFWFEAVMTLTEEKNGEIKGLLDGGTPDYKYDLSGKAKVFRNRHDKKEYRVIDMIAHGATEKTKGHVYKYYGLLSCHWPDGVNQIESFTGTMIRAVRPDDRTLEGTVGCFTSVKKNKI